ncbi:unnamed protein product [Bemisia tabaci]|uniref:60S ribosomal protein L18a n=1 Tax=Bemisia tabaci TaxID=7038 RepID=A0A9P0AMH8_BEMTA|nr:PREDICTED: 60S ribosomal protein L18a [Bemisia tabaci]CAH0393928.1 unnamed protein product [Bemisia tabaci]
MKIRKKVREFRVIGRKMPKNLKEQTPLYRMRIFAPNRIIAKSRFWYFLRQLRKFKKSTGEIVQVKEIFEKDPTTVKNIGIWLRYDHRNGTSNMYREYRALSTCSAVGKMYREMASKHKARVHSIQIIRIATIKEDDVRRPYIKQWLQPNIKFPLVHRIVQKRKLGLFTLRKNINTVYR